MLIIEEIKWLETDRDPYEMFAFNPPDFMVPVMDNDGATARDCKTIHELVRGRRFRRPSDGTDIVIGMSQQAGETLGLMYEAWENLEAAYTSETNAHTYALKRIQKLEKEIVQNKQAGFWKRLKMVFTGYEA